WDWAGARRDLEQAEALGADQAVVQNSRARLLGAAGRHDEAVAAQRRTLEVEPLAAVFHGNLVHHLLAAGRLDEAREAVRRTLEISPKLDVALEWQAVLDLLQGRPEAALLGFQGIQRPASVRLRNLAVANHALGRERESMEALAELERDHPGERFLIAGVHARRGDRDGAFRWLEEAAESRDADLTWMNLSWALRSLRGDPRYAALLRKMNLPVD
ncbi:MAG TPA: tetratricopeptide repeat protein, partial [Anaeromyxobacteraceae bacterium]|nr:tetratricopeptide repeat protein [Anaeromyxobacteraceae bacterium]